MGRAGWSRVGRSLRRPFATAVALSVALALLPALPARGADGRCETTRPTREPTAQGPGGWLWVDEEGIAHSGPDDDPNFYQQVDPRKGRVQGRAQADDSAQYSLDPEHQCVVAGAWSAGATGPWEFEGTEPVTEPVPLPWLRREGRFWQASDGRTTILYGVDTRYSVPGVSGRSFRFLDEDFDRIRSWGMNVLRVRLQDYRAGYFPSVEAEPGYLEHLDRLIEAANRRGIYVIIATGGPETQAFLHRRRGDPGQDQLKFIEGTAAHEHWLGYLGSLYERYSDWPGVVGFDAINEDFAYPPGLHDQVFMERGHRAALDLLRRHDSRHVYFQQPAGYAYLGLSTAVGHDLGDTNRNFCTKWTANAFQGGRTHDERMEEMARWAEDAGTPLFVCEYTLYRNPNGTEEESLTLQRRAIAALDRHFAGSTRNLYALSGQANDLLDPDRSESFWVRELVRPYPAWVGGEPTRLHWDFDARRLTLDLALDGSGTSEVFVSPVRTYPDGFVALTSDGRRLVHRNGSVESSGLAWDPETERLLLPPGAGALTLTVEPLEA